MKRHVVDSGGRKTYDQVTGWEGKGDVQTVEELKCHRWGLLDDHRWVGTERQGRRGHRAGGEWRETM